jgi:hypothetical protein
MLGRAWGEGRDACIVLPPGWAPPHTRVVAFQRLCFALAGRRLLACRLPPHPPTHPPTALCRAPARRSGGRRRRRRRRCGTASPTCTRSWGATGGRRGWWGRVAAAGGRRGWASAGGEGGRSGTGGLQAVAGLEARRCTSAGGRPSQGVGVEGCLAHDTLALAALHIHLCPPTTTLPLSCCLVMEFVPGSSLFRSPAAFAPGCLAATAADLGRLFTLDMLLGNPDRLRCEELAWRGNTGGLWLFFERGGGGGALAGCLWGVGTWPGIGTVCGCNGSAVYGLENCLAMQPGTGSRGRAPPCCELGRPPVQRPCLERRNALGLMPCLRLLRAGAAAACLQRTCCMRMRDAGQGGRWPSTRSCSGGRPAA